MKIAVHGRDCQPIGILEVNDVAVAAGETMIQHHVLDRRPVSVYNRDPRESVFSVLYIDLLPIRCAGSTHFIGFTSDRGLCELAIALQMVKR